MRMQDASKTGEKHVFPRHAIIAMWKVCLASGAFCAFHISLGKYLSRVLSNHTIWVVSEAGSARPKR